MSSTAAQKATEKYRKTRKGVLVTIYNGSKQKAKRRNMSLPEYSLKEFLNKFLCDAKFLSIYESWCLSGFITELKPSIDRLDNTQSYTFDNIQMVTWRTNLLNANQKTNPIILNKPVQQLEKHSDTIIAEYISAAQAQEVTSVNKSHIGSVCRGLRKSAGGFRWIFKNE